MKIHIYSIMRNEEDILPYFLRHYSTFADKIFIIDDKSTDKTLKIAKANKKVRILKCNFAEGFLEDERHRFIEDAYKKHSRGVADWIMVVDGDEFIYHKSIVATLEWAKKEGHKAIRPTGFTMFSEKYPTTKGQIYEECFMGARTRLFDKIVVIDPEIDVYFFKGRHKVTLPEGIPYFKDDLLLLHYRYLSLYTSIKRLITSSNRFTDEGLIININKVFERTKLGIEMLKNGQLLKLV